jgi:hypothetical protein
MSIINCIFGGFLTLGAIMLIADNDMDFYTTWTAIWVIMVVVQSIMILNDKK